MPHVRVEMRANLKSISHRCHLFEVASVWELTKEAIHSPLGCLQVGSEALDSSDGPYRRPMARVP
jgi:hypothetical protein